MTATAEAAAKAAPPTVVVDTSVVAKWFFPESLGTAADGLLDEAVAGGVSLAAPDLIIHEFSNLLWKRAGRQEIKREQAEAMMDEFLSLPITLAPADALAGHSLEVALESGCTAYDGAFIALAELLGSRFITADKKLAAMMAATKRRGLVRYLGAR